MLFLVLFYVFYFQVNIAAGSIDDHRGLREPLTGSRGWPLSCDATFVKHTVVTRAEKSFLVGFPVNLAAKMGTSGIECYQTAGISFDQHLVAFEVEDAFERTGRELIQLPGEQTPGQRL